MRQQTRFNQNAGDAEHTHKKKDFQEAFHLWYMQSVSKPLGDYFEGGSGRVRSRYDVTVFSIIFQELLGSTLSFLMRLSVHCCVEQN